ncbi:MAG: biotin--[acetyl-CoA-carboxylase] ligase [Gemmatimonadaceae bacterium]
MADPVVEYDGCAPADLSRRCGVARVVVFEEVNSTMDAAHDLAESGAPAGTIVLTDRQSAGRGRGGRVWHAVPGESLLFTLIERPVDDGALAVLSLRLGMAAARVLDRFAPGPVQLKWPNDLMIGGGKLAGILLEARWRHQRPEWVAIGLGLNVRRPPMPGTAGLAPGTPRVEILADLIPALRVAAAATDALSPRELETFALRDWARDRAIVAPAVGVARGISSAGALLVETSAGVVSCAAGSLMFGET